MYKRQKLICELNEDGYLTYITQVGDYIVAQYVTVDSYYYGVLLNEDVYKRQALYSEVFDAWLQSTRINIKESTYARYSHLIDTHIRSQLGKYQI